MKILLDHNVPHDLRSLFPERFEVYTAQYLGWTNYEDEELLDAAVEATFSVVVTLDRNLPHQQELHSYEVGVVVRAVHPATPSQLARRMDRISDALTQASSEQSVLVLE